MSLYELVQFSPNFQLLDTWSFNTVFNLNYNFQSLFNCNVNLIFPLNHHYIFSQEAIHSIFIHNVQHKIPPIPIPELEWELGCKSNSGIELAPTIFRKVMKPIVNFVHYQSDYSPHYQSDYSPQWD